MSTVRGSFCSRPFVFDVEDSSDEPPMKRMRPFPHWRWGAGCGMISKWSMVSVEWACGWGWENKIWILPKKKKKSHYHITPFPPIMFIPLQIKVHLYWTFIFVNSHYRSLSTIFMKTLTEEGPATFYRGYLPTVLGVIPYGGISFFTYETFKKRHRGKNQGYLPTVLRVGRGDNLQLFIPPLLKYEGWLYNIRVQGVWKFHIHPWGPVEMQKIKILNFVLIIVNMCSNDLKRTTRSFWLELFRFSVPYVAKYLQCGHFSWK